MTLPATALDGKLIVVTGGLGILGQAIAQLAVARGARVALIDRTEPPYPDHHGECLLGATDLADPTAARSAFQSIFDQLGPIHALLNVAGAFEWQPIADGDFTAWQRLFAANVLSAAGSCIAAVPHMPAGAAIVNVAAAAAARAGHGMGPYAAAKSGVLRLTESLAEELKPRGIRVNSVSPTVLDTPRNRLDMPDVDPATWLQPEVLARTLLFLCSPESAALTGANLLAGG
jgi:NAD(P)-dependent dehydrogenase (short-subunit alcohol dehydrogenase family)